MARRIKEEPMVHQERIAAEAATIFSQKGIDNTTMDEIAKAAGYSKATLYVYFNNKEDIVNYLAYKSMTILKAVLEKALQDNNTTREKFYGVCFALAKFYEEYPDFYDMALNKIPVETQDDSSLLGMTYKIGEEINAIIANYIREGVERKDLTQPDDYVETIIQIWAMISGLIKIAKEKEDYILVANNQTKMNFLEKGFAKIYRTIEQQ